MKSEERKGARRERREDARRAQRDKVAGQYDCYESADWDNWRAKYKQAYVSCLAQNSTGWDGMSAEDQLELMGKAHTAGNNAAKKWYMKLHGIKQAGQEGAKRPPALYATICSIHQAVKKPAFQATKSGFFPMQGSRKGRKEKKRQKS